MTEARPIKKRRWSAGKVRALAWVTGVATFASGLGILGVAPKPASAGGDRAAARKPPARQKVIVRHITRRVVIVAAPAPAPVSYVPSYASSSSGGYSAPAPVSSGGSNP